MTVRRATFERRTRETEIAMRIDLDGTGSGEIETTLPFLDHMLSALSCHGRFDLAVSARGDVEVDPHHLVEDCGIALGTVFARALASTPALARAGCFDFPMDGSLARVAVDLCGRPNLVWNVETGTEPLGGVPPALFRDFFKGFADGLRATVHVNVPYRDNDHHALEAVFKAAGRALRRAVTPVEGAGPTSTKGSLDA